ncbi:hypothetical protein MITS9509_01571 [Synechococcus sp. MIT S9509]|uniref:hypothetical protein n=1 Tax=unclassified Synechococcus TaxID=2626047 RepID=UPI0007BB186F|nr:MULTISPECIES: hypothetical protein [unclassified Synechococcus]KZR88102.1 hypothetical protein MITS9504_00529 [Synechococcus sp. MIT S9504]KZR92113.1 hypothetical protein MITS9509_01571 [Synechococcus sp. MIT S9509]
MIFNFTRLLDAGVAVNDEIHVHIHELKNPLLTPEDREHIQCNLAGGCARGLQVIGMHQLHLSFKLDEPAVEMADA